SHVARHERGGCERDDRLRLRRADHEGAPARVRRRDEPAHSVADGGLGRVVEVEHVDFISVPVSDLERSTAWYRDALGLPQTGEGGFPEFKLGDNVFLYLIDPKAISGNPFEHPHGAPIALRVADIEATRNAMGAPCGCSNALPLIRSEEHTSELQSRGHFVCRL